MQLVIGDICGVEKLIIKVDNGPENKLQPKREFKLSNYANELTFTF